MASAGEVVESVHEAVSVVLVVVAAEFSSPGLLPAPEALAPSAVAVFPCRHVLCP